MHICLDLLIAVLGICRGFVLYVQIFSSCLKTRRCRLFVLDTRIFSLVFMSLRKYHLSSLNLFHRLSLHLKTSSDCILQGKPTLIRSILNLKLTFLYQPIASLLADCTDVLVVFRKRTSNSYHRYNVICNPVYISSL